MTAGKVCLLLALAAFLAAPVLAQDAKPKGEATIEFGPDGSIEVGENITRYWQVNHGEPSKLAAELKKYMGKELVAEPQSQNVLRIQTTAEKWPIVMKLMEVLDVPVPQVYVEAKIIEIKYDSNLEFGFEGGYDRRAATEGSQPFFGSFTGAFNPESYLESLGTKTPFSGGTFEFETVGGDFLRKYGNVSYVFRALQARGSAEILSQPSIIAMQGKKATITTGLRFPVQSVEVRGNQSYVTTKFEKTGIKLDITPQLVGREFVTLDIHAEDSQITETIPGPNGSLNPVIAERTAETQVNVRDGETIIIGGLLSNSLIESKVGVPFLSDIPILSYFLSSTRSEEVKSELVFFITPRIIKRTEAAVIVPPGERKRTGQ